MRQIIVSLLLALGCLLPTGTALPLGAEAVVQVFPETGYSVSDKEQARFLGEFRRLGGVESLGYPISEPFVSHGFTYQAFQRAILQWRPEANQAYLANAMDWLSDAGKDAYLATLGIPRPLADAGGNWSQVVAEREAWLTEPHIAAAYRRGGGYARYGLPASRPEQAGPFVVQRFQRYAFQLWTQDVPGMPPRGSVVGVLAGDIVKQAGLVPEGARAPAPAADAVACTSNPNSAIKSRDVDVVRYRFVSVAWDKVGLEVTVRNNCAEPRQIMFRARVSATPGGAPTALGNVYAADFRPHEEKEFRYSWGNPDGSYPRIDPSSSLTFRWNWQRQGSSEPPCLDVGAERCLVTDPWLRSTVQDLAALPAGAALLRTAAQFGVKVERAELPASLLGSYRLATKTITINAKLDEYSEFELATVLAHELTHARDHAENRQADSAQSCLAAEERAFRQSADIWHALWGGALPQPAQNPVQVRMNDITAAARSNSGRLAESVLALYGAVCGEG